MVNEGEAYFSAFTLCTHACPFLFMQHSFVYMKLTFKHKKQMNYCISPIKTGLLKRMKTR